MLSMIHLDISVAYSSLNSSSWKLVLLSASARLKRRICCVHSFMPAYLGEGMIPRGIHARAIERLDRLSSSQLTVDFWPCCGTAPWATIGEGMNQLSVSDYVSFPLHCPCLAGHAHSASESAEIAGSTVPSADTLASDNMFNGIPAQCSTIATTVIQQAYSTSTGPQ